MSTAIEMMMAEHRVIESVLASLAEFVRTPDATPAKLAEYVEFFVAYSDTLHHAKEEDILFEMLVEHGMSRDSGPVGCMMLEHGSNRALVGQLREASEREQWSQDDRDQVTNVAEQFVSLLGNHIKKEDNVLYPLAMSMLPEAAVGALDDRCASWDANDDQRVKLEQLATTLTQR